jgi:hypothetical protein
MIATEVTLPGRNLIHPVDGEILRDIREAWRAIDAVLLPCSSVECEVRGDGIAAADGACVVELLGVGVVQVEGETV